MTQRLCRWLHRLLCLLLLVLVLVLVLPPQIGILASVVQVPVAAAAAAGIVVEAAGSRRSGCCLRRVLVAVVAVVVVVDDVKVAGLVSAAVIVGASCGHLARVGALCRVHSQGGWRRAGRRSCRSRARRERCWCCCGCCCCCCCCPCRRPCGCLF
ncbi:hypothetical protein BC831DRAFT_467038 [Entophlyctis helioformis]|nr:hypothetical protein BC831DRAFT_467038 [Entophlyctis helioformis]